MTLTFYNASNSTSDVTSAVLAELEYNLEAPLCTRVQLSIQAGDTKSPSFLSSVNPNGRVPAIVHDGVPIWESAAITMHLGEMLCVDDKRKVAIIHSTQPSGPNVVKQ
jgi:glutathione S-transferase